MSDENSSPDAVFRDGTSQAARRPVALDPSYVSVDERSIKDFLDFSASYAKTLNYYDLENHPAGDWSGFLGLDPEDQNAIAEIAAFVELPDKFAAPTYDRYRRPHFALFLTFLKLLQQLQAQFNTFTRRHLEFYYRTVLQLAPKQSRPNQVHAVIELVDGQPDYLVPAGTLLAAGQDSGGADLFYATDGDILANQAKVASLKSAYTQTTVIGPAEVRRNPELVLKDGSPFTSQKDWRFVAMMQMALGFQDPREPLPKFPLGDESDPSRKPLDSSLLTSLDGLLDFVAIQPVHVGFHLSFPYGSEKGIGCVPRSDQWRVAKDQCHLAKGRATKAAASPMGAGHNARRRFFDEPEQCLGGCCD